MQFTSSKQKLYVINKRKIMKLKYYSIQFIYYKKIGSKNLNIKNKKINVKNIQLYRTY